MGPRVGKKSAGIELQDQVKKNSLSLCDILLPGREIRAAGQPGAAPLTYPRARVLGCSDSNFR
jgi:hypothetical protein